MTPPAPYPSEKQSSKIISVTMDMWQAYENAAKELLPNADIVFDRFHVSQHLNQAVDQMNPHPPAADAAKKQFPISPPPGRDRGKTEMKHPKNPAVS